MSNEVKDIKFFAGIGVGRAFETRFEFDRITTHFIELNKDGINLRVRLWPDKAYWGRISLETNDVTKWNFLQTGGGTTNVQ